MVLASCPWLFLFVVEFIGLPACVAAADSVPRFADYSVASEKLTYNAKVRLDDQKSREFRTMLREAAKKKPNFAGHYILTSWGCGASCIMTAVIDARNGEVLWLPFTVCCWPPTIAEPIEYHLTSRLLIVHGSRDEKGNGDYYYFLEGKTFKLLQAKESTGH